MLQFSTSNQVFLCLTLSEYSGIQGKDNDLLPLQYRLKGGIVLVESNIEKLKILLQDKEHIHITIHVDYLSYVEGMSFENANVYLKEENVLVIEDAKREVTLTEKSIIEIDQISAKIKVKDKNERTVIVSILARS